jgi:hypothetical protein
MLSGVTQRLAPMVDIPPDCFPAYNFSIDSVARTKPDETESGSEYLAYPSKRLAGIVD